MNPSNSFEKTSHSTWSKIDPELTTALTEEKHVDPEDLWSRAEPAVTGLEQSYEKVKDLLEAAQQYLGAQ